MSAIRRNICRSRILPLALLAGLVGFPACQHQATRPVTNQVVVLGFDGMSPVLAAKWMEEGKLPNFEHLAQTGTFMKLGTTNPPESPVAWASFATGLGPGGTGIYDFLARNPKTYLPRIALVAKRKPKFLFGLIPIRPPKVTNERHGIPFYEAVADAGYKTTVLRMPLEFPPSPVPGGKLLAGLGVPDVRGTWGTFFYFASDLAPEQAGNTEFGGKLVRLNLDGADATAEISGPVDPTTNTYRRISVPVSFQVTPDKKAVTIRLDGQTETVAARHWSKWFEEKFPVNFFLSVHAISRFYVLESSPALRVYMCPLNIDPKDPALPVSYPANWSKQLADKWGDFKTLGWWHDTWGLNEGRISDGVFLQDTFRTMNTLTKILLNQLQDHPPSLMVAVYTSTDSVSHMFWRLMDPQSPTYNPVEAKKYGDAILETYEQCDKVVGEVEKRMKPGGTLIIVSDHGFHAFNKGFNTNTWLVKNGYMVLKNPNAEEKKYTLDNLFSQGSFFPNVDWSQTKAYALGLGQIYLNIYGRERYGIVEPGAQAHQLEEEIRSKLLAYRDPQTHQPVLEGVYLGHQIDHGAYAKEAPDLQLDFYPGYRTSWETSLGAIPPGIVVTNTRKWSGDHCASDPKDTQAILFINRKLDSSDPRIIDVAPTVLKMFNVSPPDQLDGKPWALAPSTPVQAER
ncbi:MAG: alkaline phosphatase family protein [Acidobacteria bacterium]|nr:alkaline phosphatase family protein [Acidobacteriota bacterium]